MVCFPFLRDHLPILFWLPSVCESKSPDRGNAVDVVPDPGVVLAALDLVGRQETRDWGLVDQDRSLDHGVVVFKAGATFGQRLHGVAWGKFPWSPISFDIMVTFS